jgi:site-specific recombinase XerD
MREALKLPADAVIHSFRHTSGTRLGEAGVDAFTIVRIMGDFTVVVSQEYVHPIPEAVERAFERLNAANEKALASLPRATQSRQIKSPSTAVSTRLVDGRTEVVEQVL